MFKLWVPNELAKMLPSKGVLPIYKSIKTINIPSWKWNEIRTSSLISFISLLADFLDSYWLHVSQSSFSDGQASGSKDPSILQIRDSIWTINILGAIYKLPYSAYTITFLHRIKGPGGVGGGEGVWERCHGQYWIVADPCGTCSAHL